MRIAVLGKSQSPSDIPSHHISRARAEKFVRRRIAVWITANRLLKMVRDGEEIRGDIRFLLPEMRITRKRTVWRENLLLHYPHKSQESKR